MMTRQHFIAFAEAIAQVENTREREGLASRIGDVLRASNPRFDWARFHAHILKTREQLDQARIPTEAYIDPRD